MYGIEIGIADGLVQVGRAHLINENFDQDNYYLLKADSISREKQFDEKRLDALHFLAHSYKSSSQYKNASEVLSSWMDLKNQKDSLFNDQVVQTLQMRYESNRQLRSEERRVGKEGKERR